MMLSEFSLIEQYFTRTVRQPDCQLGVGDDCALLTIESGMQLAVSVDTLVENVHFLANVDSYALGYKSLAVGLSDLAAVGAEPRFATLALTLPDTDSQWLDRFKDGFFEIADRYHVDLIGGDTTRGPLSVTVQVHGVIPQGLALLRSGARQGDLIYVTGLIGEAGLALKAAQGEIQGCHQVQLDRLNQPEPRIEAGLALRTNASACIDISDGLIADLSHILQASQVGAIIEQTELPVSEAVLEYQLLTRQPGFAMTAGDDYELCFTIPASHVNDLEIISKQWPYQCTCIGQINDSSKLIVLRNGEHIEITGNGYQHFS